LRDLLLEGAALPQPERLARLPEELADLTTPAFSRLEARAGAVGDTRRRVDPGMAQRSAEVLGRLVPALAGTARRIADAVSEQAEGDPADERVVHGDLYESQVFVAPDQRLGLLDLDDLGPGDPALDAANFCAHLTVLAATGRPVARRVLSYRESLRAAFLERLGVGRRSLAWREAYTMLLLASGPFRVLQPDWPGRVAARLGLAERLLDDPG
jgi:aminoglycoside phosphotransferase (APT) family kinase protein